MNKNLNSILVVSSFMNRDGFAVGIGTEGIVDRVFGCRAGPSSDGFNLAHEIAHLIELGKIRQHRFKDGNMTFKTNETWCYDRFICEPNTDQMSRRELRTFVIQYQIMVAAGAIQSKSEFLKTIYPLFSWMPDAYNFHKDATVKGSKEFENFVKQEFNSLLADWSLQKIMKIWNGIKLS